jgi:hypothetical protein
MLKRLGFGFSRHARHDKEKAASSNMAPLQVAKRK